MAKQGRAPKHGSTSEVQLVGTGEVPATYSDVFVVVNEAETGMGSLYFYQRLLADRGVALGHTETSATAIYSPKAKCVSRIVMSQVGIDKLLGALAENRGFTITPKVQESK